MIILILLIFLIIICLYYFFKKKENYLLSKKPLLPSSLTQKFNKFLQIKLDKDSIQNIKIKKAAKTISNNLKILQSSYKNLDKYLKNTKISDPDYYTKVKNAINITKTNLPIPTKKDFSRLFTQNLSPKSKNFNKNYNQGLLLNQKLYNTKIKYNYTYNNTILLEVTKQLQRSLIPENFTDKRCSGKIEGIKWGKFCGPGGNWNDTKNEIPCDMLDSCCKTHDGEYTKCGGWCKDNAGVSGLGGCVWDECIVKADLKACVCFQQAFIYNLDAAVYKAIAVGVFCEPLRYILAIIVLGIKWFLNLLADIGGWIIGFLVDLYITFIESLKDMFESVYTGIDPSSKTQVINELEKILDKLNNLFTKIEPKPSSKPESISDCNEFCYQDKIVRSCRDPISGLNSNKIIENSSSKCCKLKCINNIPTHTCGESSLLSREFGKNPVIIKSSDPRYECINNLPRLKESRRNRPSFCDSDPCRNYSCENGYTPICSDGSLAPQGCFCVRNNQ